MNVNHEIKSQLAKLLATEDLVVENKEVDTASFNVHTRVLTLPQWEKASSLVYDLLVGHEVGHALFTPDIEWYKDYQISPGIVNVVEDARIEKLMKRKYGGLAKTFYRGYNELNENDFFKLEDEDINQMSLPDRINLHFKLGNFVDIDFTIEETHFVARIEQCETFDDVLRVSEDLHNFCKTQDEQREQDKVEDITPQGIPFEGNGSDGETESEMQTNPSKEEEGEAEGGNVKTEETQTRGDTPQPQTQPQTGGSQSSLGGESSLDVKTDRALQESLKDLVDTNEYYKDTNYIEIPKIDLDKVIVNNSDLHSRIEKEWKDSYEDSVFSEVDKRFFEFKKSAQKEVNYLVKEFECKKSADAYARATTARTGILNTGVLHTYKFNEDLFKKVTVLPDGKNHGLVFILDWSGSMSRIMSDTLKQLFNLMWFCKKVQIPFEVYAFTICYPKTLVSEDGYAELTEIKANDFEVDKKFSLMNMFTSKTKGKVLDKQMKTIFRIADNFGSYYYHDDKSYRTPLGLSLSGTPLHETMIALHDILPAFKKENNVQKVQCVILTDGEGHPLSYHSEHTRMDDPTETYLGRNNSARRNCFLRCRKTGRTYDLGGGSYYHSPQYTDAFLRNLRDKFQDINFIGIRILTSSDTHSFLSMYLEGQDLIKARVNWRSTKTASIKTSGYHTYFGLSSSALNNDTEFEVKEDATKGQIKQAFARSLKGKKMNKKILSEFIELVA
tara:strand:+ start:1854 stop:4034 length:2181 start_codon:yes stop_codon:yes gene_type:complete